MVSSSDFEGVRVWVGDDVDKFQWRGWRYIPVDTGGFTKISHADFNQDGYLDIFAGEQEDPDVYMESEGRVAMKPRGLKERGVIWYNDGGRKPRFQPHVIQVDNPGWHDAQLGDVDGDGDMDIVSKVWNADGAHHHLDFWRNELIK